MTWRRQLSRHYAKRDLKCFVGLMIVLATTIVTMLLRSQYRDHNVTQFTLALDDGTEDLRVDGYAVPEESSQSWRKAVEEQRAYTSPSISSNATYLQVFRSPFVSEANPKKPYDAFKISKEAKKNVTGKKVITWYAVASEKLREDLFDEDVFSECPVNKCKFLKPDMVDDKPDRAVDAVIFPGIAGRDRGPPPRAHPGQVFIYYDLDPPIRSTQSFGGKEWNSVFNWTWSYRRDADIWEPAGTLKRAEKVKPATYFKDVAKDKSKNKHVAWFVNSCHVPSQREKYVEELGKHVNVDIYGQCGNKTCPKSFECLEMITTKYFFYLSFESAVCKDYVTDKFFHMFFEGIHVVPIVLGGAEYSKFFPEGSYIDVDWFPSPKHLADFLKLLMEDKKIYAEFLWRKSHFHFAGSSTTSALCQLCQRLHDLRTYRKTYPDFQLWYRNQQCRAPRKVY
ncbi:alpha-(1,3)-fucosyltransferase C-like isoform X2 [Littorina saxatilis]|uniref:Fucosyltransferase n=2 Tax=Littorina saxatilis TaxID=31220 RepID=A0AAN9B2J4_9CAEN